MELRNLSRNYVDNSCGNVDKMPILAINIRSKDLSSTPYPYKKYPNTITKRRVLGTKRKGRVLIEGFIIVSLLIITMTMFVRSFDKYFERQDKMLCESAKISGNAKYLRKCKCYYESGDIKCL